MKYKIPKSEKVNILVRGLVEKHINHIMRKYDFKNYSDTIRYIVMKHKEYEKIKKSND